MKKLFFLLFTLTVSYPALAVQFSFVYNGTIAASTNIPGLSAGDAAAITVTLDNGGTSLNSQTWRAASHLQSVTFDFGNGALVTTFTNPFGGGIGLTSGNFITNPSGTLTSVMTNWTDINVGSDFTTTSVANPVAWFLSSATRVYSDVNNQQVRLTNVSGIRNAVNWSPVTTTEVPEPSLFLPLLVVLALLWWRSRRTPAVSVAVYA